MPQKKIDDRIRKNLLDNAYTKYLQYFNTCIILLFTYLIGVAIVFITGEIDASNSGQIGALTVVSVALISVLVILMIKFRKKLKFVCDEIGSLKL